MGWGLLQGRLIDLGGILGLIDCSPVFRHFIRINTIVKRHQTNLLFCTCNQY